MTSIRKVKIENFQSHENTELDFEEGLNVITGPSDQGKSAIIRAIKWVLYNEPRGTDFIRQGTTSARVTVSLSNGFVITRERSKSRNKYVLEDKEGNSTIFEGFGNEVPEEIVKAHGIPKIALDKDINTSLNIGDQLEGPFLVSESPSARAKAIGRLTGLHIIDKAIRDCLVDLRRENQTIDRVENELKEIDEKIDKYKELDSIEIILKNTQAMLEKIDLITARRSKLEEHKSKLQVFEREEKKFKELLERLEGIHECEMLIKDSEVTGKRLLAMEKLHREFVQTEKLIKTDSDFLTKAAGIEKSTELLAQAEINRTTLDRLLKISKLIDKNKKEIEETQEELKKSKNVDECSVGISSLEESKIRLEKLEKLQELYTSNKNSRDEGEKYLKNNMKETEELLKEYYLALKKAGKCPVCSSDINIEKLNDIIKHYREVH